MYRLIAITTLMVSAAFAAPVGAAEQGGGDAMNPDSRADDAGKRAREALAQHLKIAPDAIMVIGSEAANVERFEHGLRQARHRGACTVMTEGYASRYPRGASEHHVHVVGQERDRVRQGTQPYRAQRRECERGLDVDDGASAAGLGAATRRRAGADPARGHAAAALATTARSAARSRASPCRRATSMASSCRSAFGPHLHVPHGSQDGAAPAHRSSSMKHSRQKKGRRIAAALWVATRGRASLFLLLRDVQ